MHEVAGPGATGRRHCSTWRPQATRARGGRRPLYRAEGAAGCLKVSKTVHVTLLEASFGSRPGSAVGRGGCLLTCSPLEESVGPSDSVSC
jgi:hypothetical protein